MGSRAERGGAGAVQAALLAQLCKGRLPRGSIFVNLEIIGCDSAVTVTSFL